jgi:hypothetical protein
VKRGIFSTAFLSSPASRAISSGSNQIAKLLISFDPCPTSSPKTLTKIFSIVAAFSNAWPAGTGVLYSVSGGILSSRTRGPSGSAAETAAAASFNLVQISDSQIAFHEPANPDVGGTFRKTIARTSALPEALDFIVHTDDLTGLGKGCAHPQGDDARELEKMPTVPISSNYESTALASRR